MRSLRQNFLIFFGAHSGQQRVAHERDRSTQRLWIAGAVSVLTMWGSYTSVDRSLLLLCMPYVCAIYGTLSLIYSRLLVVRPSGYVLAQYAFIVFDPLLTVVALVAAPTVCAPLNPLLTVQIVRCGIRYGVRIMWLSWASAVFGAALLLPASEFWMSQEQLTRSFILMLAITPLLFGPLISRLHIVTGELRVAATSDPLTGLGNRRMLADHLRLAQERAQRDSTMLSVMVLDLDNFKAVNDTLGHTTGDHLLERVASAIKRSSRAGDFLARVGGDEFVLLAEGLSTKDGVAQAEQIAAKLISTVQAVASEVCPTISVSASVGVNCWIYDRAATTSDAELVDHADRAMYSAKRGGKGRFVVAAEH